ACWEKTTYKPATTPQTRRSRPSNQQQPPHISRAAKRAWPTRLYGYNFISTLQRPSSPHAAQPTSYLHPVQTTSYSPGTSGRFGPASRSPSSLVQAASRCRQTPFPRYTLEQTPTKQGTPPSPIAAMMRSRSQPRINGVRLDRF